jgi:hypothetical protein
LIRAFALTPINRGGSLPFAVETAGGRFRTRSRVLSLPFSFP